jgi:hypothetical protein
MIKFLSNKAAGMIAAARHLARRTSQRNSKDWFFARCRERRAAQAKPGAHGHDDTAPKETDAPQAH